MIDSPLNARFSYEQSSYPHVTSTAVIRFHDAPVAAPLINAHIDRFYFFAPFCIGKKVLDLGCGFGYGTKIVAQFAQSVVAIDPDRNEIGYAMEHHRAHNISYRCEMIQDLNDREFEVSICTEVLEHVPPQDADSLLKSLAERMRPGGLSIFTTPCQTYTQKTNNPHHVIEYSLADFEALLGSYFECKSAWFYDWNSSLITARPCSGNSPGIQSPIVQIIFATPKIRNVRMIDSWQSDPLIWAPTVPESTL